MSRQLLVRSLLVSAFLVGAVAPALAQNPDLMLTPAERDSILATYDNVFPIWGRKAIERGFALPKPFGISVVGMWVDQGIEIGDLGLSTGSDPTVPIEGIQFGDSRASVYTANVRADLWVLPFLSVYGLVGKARATTAVEVVAPIEFTSTVEQPGDYAGLGMTGAFGIKRFFGVADVNWAWSKLEKLEDPVRTRVFSMRLGRAFKVSPKNRLSVWAGAMSVKFDSGTQGSIRLAEAIPPETAAQLREKLENVESGEWYQGLTPGQQVVVRTITDALLEADYSDVTVNYQLSKAPSDKWNLLMGANLDLGRSWSVRSEVGFIGRRSLLINGVYRIDF